MVGLHVFSTCRKLSMIRLDKHTNSIVSEMDSEIVSIVIHLDKKDEEWVCIKAQAYV